MPRPSSIVSFERLYLGSTALYVINAALYWSATREIMASTPQAQANPAVVSMLGAIMTGSLALTVVVSLLFWFLVARQRSVVGKWLVVVSEAVGVLFAAVALLRLARGTSPNPPSVVMGLVSTALAVAAAVFLFRPDAKVWLGEDAIADEEPRSL